MPAEPFQNRGASKKGQRGRTPCFWSGSVGLPVSYTHLKPEKPERENPVQVKPVLDSPVLGKPEQEKPAQLNTKESSNQVSNTDLSSTEGSNPIQSSPQPPAGGNRAGRDWMRERESYREIILENRCV